MMRLFSWFALLISFALLSVSLARAGNVVHVIHVDGVINAGTARYIERGIEVAERENAELLLVRLNTPGGLLNSTREIVQNINKSSVPVAIYVAPGGASATSAGTIITMSAHFAGMAPGTNIGAAHPVGGQGEDIKGAMGEKAVNDTVAFIKAQATLRKRNAQWAEKAIRESASVTAEEALKLNVVDFVAPDLREAIVQISGRKVEMHPGKAGEQPRTVQTAGLPVREIEMTKAEKFLTFLGDPNVSYLLMALGGLGIYAELSAPGVGLPGILGVICLILAFISLSTLPVNTGAVALLVLSLILFIAEVFVTSYGVLAAGGIVSLILGSILLLDPSTGDLRLSLGLVIPTALAIGVLMAAMGYAIMRSRRTVYAGLTSFAGWEGHVESTDENGYSGKCLIRGELWDFEVAEKSGPVKVGDHLEVVERKGFKLIVQRKGSV